MDRFDDAVKKVLKNEGGYVWDKLDPGGETNFGLSRKSYPKLDIKGLNKTKATEIYKVDWWERYNFELLPLGIGEKLFDMSVNMGPKSAGKILQKAVNEFGYELKVDGAIGPVTRRAVKRCNIAHLVDKMKVGSVARRMFLINRNPKLIRYISGWIKRDLEDMT